MSELSKFLAESITTCTEYCHPGRHCTESARHDLFAFLISNGKFFLPVVGIPLLIKLKHLNKKLLIDGLQYFCEATFTGYLIGLSVASLICLFRKLLGRFTKYTMIFMPVLLAGCWFYLSTPRVQRLFCEAIFQVSLEAVIRQKSNPITQSIAESKSFQTFLFMICSSIILHSKQKYKFTPFWFVKPESISTPKDHTEKPKTHKLCTHHKTSCTKYCLNGVTTYLSLGIVIDILKTILDKNPTHNILGFVKNVLTKIKKLQFESTYFFITYIAIYRATLCLLNNYWKTNKDPEINNMISAFLGGFSFMLYPKMTVLVYSLTVCLAMFWKIFKTQSKTNKSKLVEKIKTIKFDQIYFPFGLAYIVHLYIFHNSLINTLGSSLINGVTNSKGYDIWQRIQPILTSFK